MERLSYFKFKSEFKGSHLKADKVSKLWKLHPESITFDNIKDIKDIIKTAIYSSYDKESYNIKIDNDIKEYLDTIDTRIPIKIIETEDKYILTWNIITVNQKRLLRALGAKYISKEEIWFINFDLCVKIKIWLFSLSESEYRIILPIRKKTLDELIKDIFNSEIDWFKTIPKEISQEILLKNSLSEIKVLCATNQYMKNKVCDDYFWYRAYIKHYGDDALIYAISSNKIKIIKALLKYSKKIKTSISSNISIVSTRININHVFINIWDYILFLYIYSSTDKWLDIYQLLLNSDRILV